MARAATSQSPRLAAKTKQRRPTPGLGPVAWLLTSLVAAPLSAQTRNTAVVGERVQTHAAPAAPTSGTPDGDSSKAVGQLDRRELGLEDSAETGSDDDGQQSGLVLTLEQAMALASREAPELLEARAARDGVQGLRRAADRLLHRPPRVELEVGPRRLAGGGRMGVDATVGVFQEFSVGGYGNRLKRFADSTERSVDSQWRLAQVDARLAAALAWIDARLARQLRALRQHALEEAREVLRIAEARVRSGSAAPSERALARSLAGASEAAVLAAEGDIVSADAALRHVCGLDPHAGLSLIGPLDRPDLVLDETAVREAALRHSPELALGRARAEAAHRYADLGRAHSKPFVEVGPSLTREGTGDWILLGVLRMPLPGIDPMAPENALRELDARLAQARLTVTERVLLRDLELAVHEREHAIRTRDVLLVGAIEPAVMAVRESRLQYEVGRSDITTVLAARRELARAREQWAASAADVRRAEARLLRWLVGLQTTGPVR